jgi:predicted DNA-binding transcriptional regulator
MIKYILFPEHFNDLGTDCEIIPISQKNVLVYRYLIEMCINHFNNEITWDNMFNLNEAIERIDNGMVMYVGVVDYEVLGYVWFDKNRLFNLFVRNKMPIKLRSGKEFVSNVIKRFESDKIINCEVDEWNIKSHKLFQRLGFRVL